MRTVLQSRGMLMEAFERLPICRQVFPTDANFFLARMTDAQAVYDHLVKNGVVVGYCAQVRLCNDCFRVTIGSRTENQTLMAVLRTYHS